MIERYEEDRKFIPPSEKPHNEGIMLFSFSKTCYGDNLEDVLERITPKIQGYDKAIVADPHGEGIDLMEEDPVENEKYFLINSLWLVHHECVTDDDLKDDFRGAIKTSPKRTQVLVWIDAPQPECDEIEDDISELEDEINVHIVKSKEILRTQIHTYLDLKANPMRGRKEVIAWNNNVCDMLEARGVELAW